MTADSKICPSCKKRKPLSEFHKDRSRRDGLHATCKECNKAKASEWYRANAERVREYKREHKTDIREYRAKNRERIYAVQIAWRRTNPDKVQASNQRRREKARRNRQLTTPTPPLAAAGVT